MAKVRKSVNYYALLFLTIILNSQIGIGWTEYVEYKSQGLITLKPFGPGPSVPLPWELSETLKLPELPVGADAEEISVSEVNSMNGSQMMDMLHEYRKHNPFTVRTAPDFIRSSGYPVEIHDIHTKDGYILEAHRIPFGRNSGETKGEVRRQRPVVLLQHGFLCTSSDWLMGAPENALPYTFADTDLYDVWLGNIRGNKYGLRHETLKTRTKKFWDFSFHENGIYDLPRIIDYILGETGETSLYFVCHSMGCSLIYITLAEMPEYNSKIKIIFSLAPAPFLMNMKSPIRLLAPFAKVDAIAIETFGSLEIDLPAMQKILIAAGGSETYPCPPTQHSLNLCEKMFSLFGLDIPTVNQTWLPVVLSQYPDISSAKTLVHFLQGMLSARFSQYDYGPVMNLGHYGKLFPPNYKLHNVVAPVAMFSAQDDNFVVPQDITYLVRLLKNVVYSQRVESVSFNHGGFLYGIQVAPMVYDKILNLMLAY